MTLPRSGSTLLGQYLGLHSRILHIGESMYWEVTNPAESRCSCGVVGCKHLLYLRQRIVGNHLSRPLLRVWQIVDLMYWPDKRICSDSVVQDKSSIKLKSFRYWLSRCPAALDGIVSEFARVTEKDIFLDNTKLFCVGEKLVKSSSWGIIILLRDPRGVMSSYKNAGIRKGDMRGAASALPFMKDFIESVMRISGKENVFIVRYEDFCANADLILTDIVKFIGVPFESKMGESIDMGVFDKGHVLKGNRLLRLEQPTRIQEDMSWQHNLTEADLAFLYSQKEVIKYYRRFGYFTT
ncbi:MAG: sulfotransferase domain-containing protein [Patescibacteria group bacterium]|nr:sulfotransferase domain-containing protein [Patescibacteria group bacterium]